MNHPLRAGLAAVILTAFACSDDSTGADAALPFELPGSQQSSADAGRSDTSTTPAVAVDASAQTPRDASMGTAAGDAAASGDAAVPSDAAIPGDAGDTGDAGSTGDAGVGSDGGLAGDAGSAGDGGLAGDAGGGVSADAGSASDGGVPTDAAVDAGAAVPDAFAQCVANLKPKCSFEEREVGCSSLVTAPIPLTAGGTWGNIDVPGGPHGSYMEWNEGKPFANSVSLLESSCDTLAASFGEPDSVTKDTLDLKGQDLSLYTVYRPACMREGDKYPVITWGNGTCGKSTGYGVLLATLASHGFVVVASNSRFTDAGRNEMLKALDFAKSENSNPSSVLYQKLDLEKIGAMGHSQGGGATINAARDSRVKAVIIWNGGGSAVKPFLAISGDRDIGSPTPAQMASGVNGASQPGAWLFYHKVLETGGNVTGHLTLMEQPERVTDVTVAWWKYRLLGDAEAKNTFVGSSCGVCNKKDEYEYGQKGLN
jgi:hypothetical protein